MKIIIACALVCSFFVTCLAQALQTDRQQPVRVEARGGLLRHVRVIDGNLVQRRAAERSGDRRSGLAKSRAYIQDGPIDMILPQNYSRVLDL
jgi:hypothetical protein